MEFRYLELGEIVEKEDIVETILGAEREPQSSEIGDKYCNSSLKVKRPIKKENKTMKNKYIIGSINKSTNEVSFTKHPHVHDNLILASDEAERLAELDNKKKFIVVKVMGVVTVPTPGISWE